MAHTKVTITAIAREAGVSVATVSRVVNGRADVGRQTRERVQELLRRHGYRPRAGTRRGRAALVEVVFHQLGPHAGEILRGVERTAAPAGIGTAVSVVPYETTGPDRRQWLAGLRRRAPSGVILATWGLDPALHGELRRLGVPLVMVDLVGWSGAELPSVGATNWAAGRTATEHLLRLGHRRIGFIAGPPRLPCNTARQAGYREALRTAGLPVEDRLTVGADYANADPRSSLEACRRLMALPQPPTAVFASCDEMALGAREALRGLGLRVPQDVSMVGLDDLPATRLPATRLTTVRQPLREMGAVAFRALRRLSRGDRLDVPRVELATELVVRSTTAPPPPATAR
ncbi:LacI family DNA-binding transcriptional regulator [Streptomyces hoynatensis]|uniref:LacI family DNA-binding transcriptional regulator n=1 Tax=Streptomyces hoynatensis TaxID=1141874 RepID=A0A3A9Z9Y1_9ACTN|nr:LacI family DNA-binding transcriptional regulator [Streptomyces hoynatensis]RKN45028.1 LacI family DNA-binding transcriptional regulator [Streptomyces hoynatensis]